MTAEGPCLQRSVFEVGDRSYHWRDVVDGARALGDWGRIERQAAEGMACVREASATADPIDSAEVEDAADQWRYARNLLAVDETEAWLARWGLEVEQWLEYLWRSLVRDRWSGQLPVIVSRHPVSAEDASKAVWAEAVCSGALERFATTMADLVAVQERMIGDAGIAPPAAELERLFEHFRAEVLTPEAVARELGLHQLEWTRLDCRCLLVREEGAAREAALCVREDGTDLGDVASEAGVALEDRTYYLDDELPGPAARLLGAQPGDIVGPVVVPEGFMLCQVLDRALPSVADPVLRGRAERHALRDAVGREVAKRVRWHEPPSARLESGHE